jgi:hypothetical protein
MLLLFLFTCKKLRPNITSTHLFELTASKHLLVFRTIQIKAVALVRFHAYAKWTRWFRG